MFCQYKIVPSLLLYSLISVYPDLAHGDFDNIGNESTFASLIEHVGNMDYENVVEFLTRSVGLVDGLLKALQLSTATEYLINGTIQEYEKMNQLSENDGRQLYLKYTEFSRQLDNDVLQLGKAKSANDLSKCSRAVMDAQGTWNGLDQERAPYFEQLQRLQGSSKELFTKTREVNTVMRAVISQLSALINNKSDQVPLPDHDLDAKVESLDLEKYIELEQDNHTKIYIKAVEVLLRKMQTIQRGMPKVADDEEDLSSQEVDDIVGSTKTIFEVSQAMRNVFGDKNAWDFIEQKTSSNAKNLDRLSEKVTSVGIEAVQVGEDIVKAAGKCMDKLSDILKQFEELQSRIEL